MNARPNVVIVGGGFGGVAAARALRSAQCRITLIDRQNHHLFQPLLYQVATTELAPSQIGYSLRGIFHSQKNLTVALGEVTSVDKAAKTVSAQLENGSEAAFEYDYLIVATGAADNFFGHKDFENNSCGLKNLTDAVSIRNKILTAFELAMIEPDTVLRKKLLTFVMVGAGPSGVEMAGAISHLVQDTLHQEFHTLDREMTRIVLIDKKKRVLSAFSEAISAAAERKLRELGVELLLGQEVEKMTSEGMQVGDQWIPTKTIVWSAGVSPSPAARWLGAQTDHAGHVLVGDNLSIPNYPEIFVIGDTAALRSADKALPGVAQVAIQGGKYAAHLIATKLRGGSVDKPFEYHDKGSLAVIGKGYAVLETGRFKITGFVAWLIWAVVHISYLSTSSLRYSVFVQWVWTYITRQGGAQLILAPVHSEQNENHESATTHVAAAR